MNKKVVLADLSHTENGKHLFNSFPLGISYIASYAKKYLKEKIEIELFRDVEEFKIYTEKEIPDILGFSNYSWNSDLSYQFAKKIKEKNPKIIIVFGGSDYPIELEIQKSFLLERPVIDFFIRYEGEQAFLELFKALEEYNFNKDNLKKDKKIIGNCQYIIDGEIITGNNLERINFLDDIPSPYLNGTLDKFFKGSPVPLIQSTRGCPFTCSYCIDGNKYYSKTPRFSNERVKQELLYIAEKTKAPNLIIVDSNFGMWEEDVEICRYIDKIKNIYNWPKYIDSSIGKNKKTVTESLSILKDSVIVGLPVQSTDPEILKNINRTNISFEIMSDFIKSSKFYGANSFSEVILGLPGDSYDKHSKSMFDMIDIGINAVRSHQLVMVPCSDIYKKEFREKYGIITRFRIQPRRFGIYEIYGEEFPVIEIDEICISNNTLSFEEYLKSRRLDLSIEIFYNNGILRELFNFLIQKGIKASEFMKKINEGVLDSGLNDFYKDYIKENIESLWEDKNEIEKIIKKNEALKDYIKGGTRNNEQLKYRAIGIFYKIKEIHDIAFDSAIRMLKEYNLFEDSSKIFLEELKIFSLLRKVDLLEVNKNEKKQFNYDFLLLLKNEFKIDPVSLKLKNPITYNFSHNNEQKDLISRYMDQFGTSINSLGQILSWSPVNKFYREVEIVADN